MKKLPVIAFLSLFAALSFTSCKKEYTCTCTVTSPVIDTSITVVTNIDKAKKKHAEDQCDASAETAQKLAAFLFATASCNLAEK